MSGKWPLRCSPPTMRTNFSMKTGSSATVPSFFHRARSHCWGRWKPADLFLGHHQLIGETPGECLAWPFQWWRWDSTLRNSVLPNPLAARVELPVDFGQ